MADELRGRAHDVGPFCEALTPKLVILRNRVKLRKIERNEPHGRSYVHGRVVKWHRFACDLCKGRIGMGICQRGLRSRLSFFEDDRRPESEKRAQHPPGSGISDSLAY